MSQKNSQEFEWFYNRQGASMRVYIDYKTCTFIVSIFFRKIGVILYVIFIVDQIKEIKMGKGKDAKKATKKPPTKTAKEKKAEKKLKKANKAQ